ncbi:Glycosyltransferase involved in cell wall bisynthesis [Saccharopolyspora kobensis]|uniref:2-deoxystreptamine N-acetyl-D-glucosaminyltransferase / 2-deoxystreptamine glucosyltransferase n=1 Tax=Saccharopolyspora kobensis TaxID=146035 RepID=A0A1H6E4Z0_9PSEU|nr:glycosyltransferase family 4 protein [Saccharopolyspora kobensis]SEG92361.1 Glycosyltransferase involved in cell wall bisynthesis [Saccharopolyspora kobensis]SFD37005.1 2-deoxystreptamine N-acetyl-D-glucosaminyltransferase / 2-deoxystreptamine glucosyltransferase [Saccharopolyspora kobensis]
MKEESSRRAPRVLRLSPHFYWPQLAETSWPVKFDAIGGMQSQIYRLTRALDDLGVEQVVLTLDIPGTPPCWRLSEHTEVRGVRVPVLPLRSRIRGMVDLNLSWALGVVRHLVKHRKRPDLIHVHCSGVIIPPLLGWLLCRVLRVPLVLTIHCSIIVTYHPMNALDRMLQPLARWIERQAIRAATRTITLTPRTVPVLTRAAGRPESSFAVLPDVIDATGFAAAATPEAVAEVRQRWSVPSDRAVVGYIGRLAREKGWPIIIDIAEELRDEPVHWLICGDGNERDLFEKEVAQRGLTDRFTITGYVPNEEVPAAMRVMDLMLMAPLHEEFGSVMLEAMAVGLPIVAVGVGGVANVLDDGELGWLVPERTPAAFAKGIRAALDDPQWRAETAERARQAVLERYDLDQVARRTAELYDEVLSER